MKKIAFKEALFIFLVAQTLNAGWIKTLSNSDQRALGQWTEPTQDGNNITVGSYNILVDEMNVECLYLAKTNQEGNIMWTRTIGDETKWLNGRCIQLTSDGGFIIAGEVHTSPGLIKTDSSGDTLWTTIIEEGMGTGYCVREIGSDYILTGQASRDLHLTKVDSTGSIMWTKHYGDPAPSRNDDGFSLQMTPDSGFIVTGQGPEWRLWILRTDSEGDTLWTRLYQLGDPESADRGYCIEPTSDGNWVICGGMDYNVVFKGSVLLMKVNDSGDSLWTKTYNYGGSVDVARSVKQTPDGGYIMTGSKNYSMTGTGAIWLLKTDSLGDTLWTRTFGGIQQDRGDHVILTPDGGYLITGFSQTYSSNGSRQVVLIKTDSLGYVSVEEEDVKPEASLDVLSPIGSQVMLRFENHPDGFHARIFDSSGRLVDEVHSAQTSGTISWGECYGPGVYFVKPVAENSRAVKVVLTK